MQAKEIQNRLAENLKRIRKSQKLTQFQLAEMIGINPYSIRKHRWWCKTNGVKCQYHKIEVDDDDWDVED